MSLWTSKWKGCLFGCSKGAVMKDSSQCKQQQLNSKEAPQLHWNLNWKIVYSDLSETPVWTMYMCWDCATYFGHLNSSTQKLKNCCIKHLCGWTVKWHWNINITKSTFWEFLYEFKLPQTKLATGASITKRPSAVTVWTKVTLDYPLTSTQM